MRCNLCKKGTGKWNVPHPAVGDVWYCDRCFVSRYGYDPASPPTRPLAPVPIVTEVIETEYGDRRDMPDVRLNPKVATRTYERDPSFSTD